MWCGIDPGKKGALVVLDEDHQCVLELATPTVGKGYNIALMIGYVQMAAALGVRLCILEASKAMPRDGATSAWTTGYGFGIWETCLVTAKVPYQTATPSTWKRTFGISGDDQKPQAILLARKLVPGLTMRRTPKCTTDSSDHAEAALLAVYGARLYGK